LKKPIFTRTLSGSNDKLIFLIALFGGGALILFIRSIGDTGDSSGVSSYDKLAVLIAVLVIFLYGYYIYFTKDRASVTVDRASDNAYYLGLLFTLFSLAYSLVKLVGFNIDDEKSIGNVIGLLPDFGLALASTIAGILVRVLLQLIRNDPMDVENDAREKLGDTMTSLRSSISEIVNNLTALSDATKVSLGELNITVTQALKESADKNTETVKSVTDDITGLSSELKNQSGTMVNFTNEMAIEFKEVLSGLRQQFQETSNAPTQLNDKVMEIANSLKNVSESLEVSVKTQLELSKQMQESTESLRKTVENDNFSKINDLLASSLLRMGKFDKSVKSMEDLSSKLNNTATQMIENVDGIEKANVDYIKEVNNSTQLLREKTRK
jgi:hypothetical protein